jgi:hypothetical protein
VKKIVPGRVRWVDDLSGFDPKAAQVVVEADPGFHERVAFQVLHDQEWFNDRYTAWINRFNLLRRAKTFFRTCGAITTDGFDVLVLPSAEDLLVSVLFRWPVDRENPFL